MNRKRDDRAIEKAPTKDSVRATTGTHRSSVDDLADDSRAFYEIQHHASSPRTDAAVEHSGHAPVPVEGQEAFISVDVALAFHDQEMLRHQKQVNELLDPGASMDQIATVLNSVMGHDCCSTGEHATTARDAPR